jgi:hypothetical protein
MYYMQLQKTSKQQWTPSGLLGMLRATLPPIAKNAMPTIPGMLEAIPQRLPERLDSHEFLEVANAWRSRTSFGDLGAESVAQALELVASHRSAQKQSRMQAVGRKLSGVMRRP